MELDTLVDGETYIITSLGTNTGLAAEATGVVDDIVAGSDATAPLTVGTKFVTAGGRYRCLSLRHNLSTYEYIDARH